LEYRNRGVGISGDIGESTASISTRESGWRARRSDLADLAAERPLTTLVGKGAMSEPTIRLMQMSEIEATVRVWQRSQRAAYTWFRDDQWHPFGDALAFFRESVCQRCEVWVAVEQDRVVGLLALEGALIDHLFVDPDNWGVGVGSRLLEHAKSLYPAGLKLVTLQRNERARRFYEARGFVATKFGMSPPPENEPDVYYRWSPST
jgi:GNAT superfamily N-acetyltransferase